MKDLLIYFFRKNRLLYNGGLISFALLYAYALSNFFFKEQLIGIFFTVAMIVSGVWLVSFLFIFFKDKNYLLAEREKEKFYSFAQTIKNEFGLSENSNIFEKIELIKNFIETNFSNRGLFANRIFALTNSSLNIYIENLSIIKELKNVEKLTKDNNKEKEFYKEEIGKNLEQNEIIVQKLDDFIKEIMSQKNNDKKMSNITKDFEHSMEIFNTIKSRR